MLNVPDGSEAPGAVADALFDTGLCLNCRAALTGPFCAQCGQKKAGRIGRATVRQEAWARFRWFEWGLVRHALRVLPHPGTMAREYVLGMRKDHLHPLSLLCLAIGFLLVVLGHTDYLKPELPSEAAARMYALSDRIRASKTFQHGVAFAAIFGNDHFHITQ